MNVAMEIKLYSDSSLWILWGINLFCLKVFKRAKNQIVTLCSLEPGFSCHKYGIAHVTLL